MSGSGGGKHHSLLAWYLSEMVPDQILPLPLHILSLPTLRLGRLPQAGQVDLVVFLVVDDDLPLALLVPVSEGEEGRKTVVRPPCSLVSGCKGGGVIG